MYEMIIASLFGALPPPGARLGRRLLLPLALLAMAGCEPNSSASGRYPRDWPPPQPSAKQSVLCADLTGRYVIGEDVLSHAFARPDGPQDHGIHWHTLEISGDAQQYTLQFYGSGLDDEVGAPPRRSTRLMRSAKCDQGWLRRDLGRGQGTPIERAEGDTRSIDRYLLIARDRAGNLVAQEVSERYESISFWAAGGSNVRVPFTGSTDRLWSRWLAATGDPARPRVNPLAADASPALQTLGRRLPAEVEVLSRRADGDGHVLELRLADAGQLTALQERLQSSSEFGDAEFIDTRRQPGGGVVATLRIGPPRRAGPSEAEVARIAAAAAQRAQSEAMFERVVPLLRPCASVTVEPQPDGGYLLDVRCPDAEALSVFVGNLRDSPRFGIPELRHSEPYIRPQVKALVYVRER